MIRPVVTYGSAIWTLTNTEENALKSIRRKILWRICGPIKVQNEWRIRNNQEPHDPMSGQNIVKFVKSQRLRWLGHLYKMPDNRIPKRMLQGRIHTGNRRSVGRPKLKWLDGVTKDLGIMKVRGWKGLVMDRESWKAVVSVT